MATAKHLVTTVFVMADAHIPDILLLVYSQRNPESADGLCTVIRQPKPFGRGWLFDCCWLWVQGMHEGCLQAG
jgi:hypothetical protein